MSCAFFRSLTTAARAMSCACPGKTAFSAPHSAPPGEVSYVAPSTPATSNTANPPATAVLPRRERGIALRHPDAASADRHSSPPAARALAHSHHTPSPPCPLHLST